MSGWPKRCKLAHAFQWEYGYKGLELAQLPGQLGVFPTQPRGRRALSGAAAAGQASFRAVEAFAGGAGRPAVAKVAAGGGHSACMDRGGVASRGR